MTVTTLDWLVYQSTRAAEENAASWSATDPEISAGLRRGIAAAKQAFSEIEEAADDIGAAVASMQQKVAECLAYYSRLPDPLGEWECSALHIVENGIQALVDTLRRIDRESGEREQHARPLLRARLSAREQIRDSMLAEVASDERASDERADAERSVQGHVFLSYVRENAAHVGRLAQALSRSGIEVWVDRTHIKPGVRWRNAIRDAIEHGAFFVACFSHEYAAKTSSYMDEELEVAADELRRYTGERAWFIPVKLNECVIPGARTAGAIDIAELQWVDLYPDWDVGVASLLQAVAQARRPKTRGGNGVVLDTGRPFHERIRLAAEAWVSAGRGAEGLLSGKAFFTAQCWVYTHRVYDVGSPSYDEPVVEFVAASREFCGGDKGWTLMLLDHVACEACRQNYRFENIRVSTKRMAYVCPSCSRHLTDPDEDIVG